MTIKTTTNTYRMLVSTGAPRKIRWQGVVPGRGSDPKLVSIGRARAAPSVQGLPAPVRGQRVKRWRAEAGPIGVTIAGAQRLLKLGVATRWATQPPTTVSAQVWAEVETIEMASIHLLQR
jgi:hypothetical protein